MAAGVGLGDCGVVLMGANTMLAAAVETCGVLDRNYLPLKTATWPVSFAAFTWEKPLQMQTMA